MEGLGPLSARVVFKGGRQPGDPRKKGSGGDRGAAGGPQKKRIGRGGVPFRVHCWDGRGRFSGRGGGGRKPYSGPAVFLARRVPLPFPKRRAVGGRGGGPFLREGDSGARRPAGGGPLVRRGG